MYIYFSHSASNASYQEAVDIFFFGGGIANYANYWFVKLILFQIKAIFAPKLVDLYSGVLQKWELFIKMRAAYSTVLPLSFKIEEYWIVDGCKCKALIWIKKITLIEHYSSEFCIYHRQKLYILLVNFEFTIEIFDNFEFIFEIFVNFEFIFRI